MIKLKIILITCFVIFSGCSADEDTETKVSGDHVWKEQTQAIDKAKEAEALLQDAAKQQGKAIEEHTQ